MTTAAFVWTAALAFTGCTVHENANRAQRCAAGADCAAGMICYRNFCVPGAEGADGLKSDDEPAPTVDYALDAGPELDTNPPEPGPVADTNDAAPPPASDDSTVSTDSGQATGSPHPTDAGAPVEDGATPPAAPDACGREVMRQYADAYFAAMATGDVASLRRHPSLRYTENGQAQQLGLGLWTSRPQVQFVRHVIDEGHCGAASIAVLRSTGRRFIFGVRLRYLDDRLLEVEAQVVVQNFQFFNPEGLIPAEPDPWVEPIPAAMRMSHEAQHQLLANYFDSVSAPSLLPPHDPACRRRQNGVLMAQQGSCGVPPGDRPFTEKRYLLVDETNGIATAIVIYDRYLGMYLLKVAGGVIQNVDIVGGVLSQGSGW